jgi:hypothetical protein
MNELWGISGVRCRSLARIGVADLRCDKVVQGQKGQKDAALHSDYVPRRSNPGGPRHTHATRVCVWKDQRAGGKAIAPPASARLLEDSDVGAIRSGLAAKRGRCP